LVRERAHRVIFIDLARALAVVMMMYGHTVSALLDKSYQSGTWFEIWTFQRGLTSSLFLFLSGFAFSIATMRHWPAHTQLSPAVWKRARRFALFIVLGYSMHLPTRRVVDFASADDARWGAFLAVDVLQLMGVTLLFMQLLVLVSQSRRVFIALSFVVSVVLIAIAPAAWAYDWRDLQAAFAAYLTPTTGSLFPFVPWAAYALAGAAAGGLYSRWGASHLGRFANLVLLLPGVLVVLISLRADNLPVPGATGPFAWATASILMRIGACLIVLAIIAHASRRITHLPHTFGAVAQESLLIYVVHLAIIYGSTWNVGLYRFYAGALSPWATLLVVVVLVTAMVLLALQWNRLKHHRPKVARWLTVGTGATLLASLA
jgi:uncharacterized membrane protein